MANATPLLRTELPRYGERSEVDTQYRYRERESVLAGLIIAFRCLLHLVIKFPCEEIEVRRTAIVIVVRGDFKFFCENIDGDEGRDSKENSSGRINRRGTKGARRGKVV